MDGWGWTSEIEHDWEGKVPGPLWVVYSEGAEYPEVGGVHPSRFIWITHKLWSAFCIQWVAVGVAALIGRT